MTNEEWKTKILRERDRLRGDWGPFVECDEFCCALAEPQTIAEYQATLEHWKNHGWLSGCSHGC